MTNKKANSVAIFRNHPAEQWPSMERYANELVQGLQETNSTFPIYQNIPPKPFSIPKGMLLSRILVYPFWAINKQKNINHIIDHSYGHLVFALDSRRTIVTIHDIAPLYFPGRYLGFSGFAWRLAWQGTQKASHLIADSEFTRETIIKRFNISSEKITTVYLGVNPLFHPLPDKYIQSLYGKYHLQNQPILLHVGSTAPRKNIETLLRALDYLLRQGNQVSLIQVGGTPTQEQKELISSLQIQKHICFLGIVSETQLLELYNLADVFVFPSFYEGFGLPVLEAMACGTPVVASNRTSLPEVVTNAGLLIDPESPEDLAKAIGKIIDSPSLKKELMQNGLARANALTWTTTATQTANIYSNIL